MKKKNTKQTRNKGITLIALVVTIIVLLILAGVSIAMLTGQTGILTQAQQARENTRGGEVKDAVALAVAENELAKNTGNGTVRTKEDVVQELARDGKLTEQEAETLKESDKLTIGSIDIDFSGLEGETTGGTPGNPEPETGIFTKNSTIDGKTGSYDNPTIPAGFKPVNPTEDSTVGLADWGDGKKAPSQNAVNAGLVIEDKEGNQFVWVPVPKAIAGSVVSGTEKQVNLGGFDSTTTPMAEPDGSNYRGVLYQDWDVSDGKVTNIQYSASSFREPDVVKDYDGTESDPIKLTKKILQDDYDEMVKSVDKYGGFYVARYEMSLSSDTVKKAQFIKGAISATAKTPEENEENGANTWYGFYEKQKEFATKCSNSVKSSMIWGSQYDAMLNWMARCGIDVTAEIEDFNTGRTAGTVETDKINNIYDLYGNLEEWTLEVCTTGRMLRNGSNGGSYTPSVRAYDDYNSPTETHSTNGSRASLYIVGP